VSNDLCWIEDDETKENIWNQASARMSERSGRTAMGAMSRKFRIPSSAGSFELDIHEPTMTGDDLGLKTWAASYMLARRLHTFGLIRESAEERPRVLELGSGTGLVGLAMAGLGADVVLTDMSSIYANLARNVESHAAMIEHRGGCARAGVLDWTDPTVCDLRPGVEEHGDIEPIPTKFPLILAADSLYSPEHPHMLVDTISVWLAEEASAKVVVEFPYREAYLPEIASFRERMTKLGLHILQEGEEKGYDDWGTSGADEDDDDEDSAVTCWWSIWGRRSGSVAGT